MPQALPLTAKIGQDYKRETSFNDISIQFGNGVVQSGRLGTITSLDTYTVSWTVQGSTDRDTIQTALKAVGGWDYLTWTPPDQSTSKKFRLPNGFQIKNPSGTLWVIEATLKEIP